MPQGALTKIAKTLVRLKHEKNTLNEKMKHVNMKIAEAELAISTKMLSDNIQSFKSDGKTFTVSSSHFPRIVNEKKFVEFCKTLDVYNSLYSMSVHSATLRGWYNEWLEEHKGEPDPPGLEVFRKPKILVRGLNA